MKLPDIKEAGISVTNLKKDISMKKKKMNAEQLNGLREYMQNMPC